MLSRSIIIVRPLHARHNPKGKLSFICAIYQPVLLKLRMIEIGGAVPALPQRDRAVIIQVRRNDVIYVVTSS